MRGNTLTMLVIAVFFGAIAVFLANIWLKAQAPGPVVQVIQPSNVETSTIVVAGRDMKFGEPLNEEILREIPWPKTSVPDGAFAKIDDVIKDGRRVVLTSISPNEPILKWKISGPGARASLSALVNDGMRAVTVRVNDSSGVAGFILPGDRVDVLYTRDEDDSTIDILLQNVRILAIDQIADEKKSDPIAAKSATLELMPLDAQKISLAQATGTLTLTLRSAGSVDSAPAQRIVEDELVSNPSVYQTVFDAQAVAQSQLDKRLLGLEGSLTQVQGSVSEVEGKVLDKVKGSLMKVEDKLLGKIQSADASRAQLMAKLAGLESIVKDAAKATDEGEGELRKKLAALETAIRKAGSATGVDEKALRSRLAEFEASLRKMMADANKPVTVAIQPASDTVVVREAEATTANIKVYRGVADTSYTVPLDANGR